MSTYAISDIHGCYHEFMKLLDLIGFGDEDELLILGDVVDRGLGIAECIRWLVDRKANTAESNVTFLRGNHEQMTMWAFNGRWSRWTFDMDSRQWWTGNGGIQTLEQMEERLSKSELDAFQEIVESAPNIITRTIDDKLMVFTHAGIRAPEDPSEKDDWFVQTEDDLLWEGRQWYMSCDIPPFHVISGHVPTSVIAAYRGLSCSAKVKEEGKQNRIMHWRNKHAIDCGCVFDGNLGALRLEDFEGFYVAREAYLS